jgi:hypothetical protein
MQGVGVTDGPRFLPSATGLLAHFAWMIVWGIAFAAMAHRKTPPIVLLLALVVGGVAALAASSLVPAALGAVQFAVMPGSQAALCVALMTAGLVTGRALSHAE